MFESLPPWLVGFVALGVGYVIVGNSPWLFAFCVPAVFLTFVLVLNSI